MMNELNKWIKIALLICGLIIILVGFLAGYFSGGNECEQNPFIFGIKEINELNEDEFHCNCYSIRGKEFSFDDKRIQQNKYFDDFLN